MPPFAASSVGSGWPTSKQSSTSGLPTTWEAAWRPTSTAWRSSRARCSAQVAAHVALGLADLAVDGDDLMRALGLGPGPALGRLLDDLLERVLVDPMLNERARLLAIAAELATRPADPGAPAGNHP